MIFIGSKSFQKKMLIQQNKRKSRLLDRFFINASSEVNQDFILFRIVQSSTKMYRTILKLIEKGEYKSSIPK